MRAELVREGDWNTELPERRVKLEEVLPMGDSARRAIVRFVGDDARVPFEVPDGGAAERCLFGRGQLLEGWKRIDRGHARTITTRSACTGTEVRR